ncbi:hypothetical protein LWP59_17975 [Amycolatopsis acidiphila]|nr:Chromate resistance protein ChrB [Amycolatopsis acidiphila]UIJ63389.1 hypothetical protein LWP59_17975 [Amycolatopsis acidiphila]GHG75336.1 hypothetical protein GCM10017788_40160 [Amycolatopsis acidiphila]
MIGLARRGEGEVVVLGTAGRAESDGARLEGLFTAGREAEWTEFLADCGKFDAEIDEEIRNGKFTMAELEEQEQSPERLRRWHRDLRHVMSSARPRPPTRSNGSSTVPSGWPTTPSRFPSPAPNVTHRPSARGPRVNIDTHLFQVINDLARDAVAAQDCLELRQ